MSRKSDLKTPDYHDQNFFYEYGDNPKYKNLIGLVQANNYKGALPIFKTVVYDKPKRWFPFRNMDDFLSKDMRVYSFPRTIPFLVAGFAFFIQSIAQARTMLPVGRYGYTKISQTPFFKHWGSLGAAAVLAYPCVMGYLFYRVLSFSSVMFFQRVILQERNWFHEYQKFDNPHGNYNFKDAALSQDDYVPKEARVAMKKNSLPDPLWFKQ